MYAPREGCPFSARSVSKLTPARDRATSLRHFCGNLDDPRRNQPWFRAFQRDFLLTRHKPSLCSPTIFVATLGAELIAYFRDDAYPQRRNISRANARRAPISIDDLAEVAEQVQQHLHDCDMAIRGLNVHSITGTLSGLAMPATSAAPSSRHLGSRRAQPR